MNRLGIALLVGNLRTLRKSRPILRMSAVLKIESESDPVARKFSQLHMISPAKHGGEIPPIPVRGGSVARKIRPVTGG